MELGIARLKRRYPGVKRFIAYFQPATNTYAPVQRLRKLYYQALDHPEVVGLAIGTRPDCVPEEVLELLQELAQRTYLSVEYGLQTIHNRTLQWMNRGHGYEAFVDAVQRSRHRGFELCAHVILGLPGESHQQMLATADELARLQLDAVKIHNLCVVHNTPLAQQYARGEVRLLEREQFVQVVVDFLERLPPTCVVERVSGDAPPEYLIAPRWCLDKQSLRQAILQEFQRRGSWQGKHCRWAHQGQKETSAP